MGRINLSVESNLTPPGVNTADIVYDGSELRLKAIDSRGIVHVLSRNRVSNNYLYNGDFSLRQRVAAGLTNFTGSTTGRVYTADRWGHTTGNATTPQFQQVDTSTTPETGTVTRYFGLFKQITNAAKICVSQFLPAVDCLELRGQKVRFSVKMRRLTGADRTMNLGIIQLTNAGTVDTLPATFISAFNGAGTDPTWGTNLSLITPDTDKLDNCTVVGSKLACSMNGNWQRFSGVFTMPSNFKNIGVVIFSNDVFAANDDLLLTECGLYAGHEIIDFGARDYADEVRRCQHFYCKTFALGTAPAQNAGVNTGEHKTKKIVAAATAGRFEEWQFPTPMRITPATVTTYNPAAANVQARDETNNVDCSATTVVGTTDRQTAITFTGNAATVAEGLIGVHITADAEL